MTLAEQPIGREGTVAWVHAVGTVGDRLMEMGLTPGATVCVLRRGAGGELLQLLVRGYRLSLRRDEALAIELTVP